MICTHKKILLCHLCIGLKESEITNHLQWSVCINFGSPNGRYLRRLGGRLQEGLLTQASLLFLSGLQLPDIWNWLFSSTGQIYFQSGKYSYFKGTSCMFFLKCKVTQDYTLFIALAFIHVCSKAFVTVINAWGAGLVCQLNLGFLHFTCALGSLCCLTPHLLANSGPMNDWAKGIFVEINSCGFYKQLTWFPFKLLPPLLILNFTWGDWLALKGI